ncbi:MAG: polysaccharide deacetylase family protein [candidate division Zixibacteria bacterium]|nr:polysaccharide deacetylase family protein [candidate division Zixibacteria bacterium]
MFRALFVIAVMICASTAQAAKELAVTIDDLPFLYGRYLPDSVGSERFRDVLKILRQHDVKVIGFVVGSQINERRQQLLDEFVAEGHVVGNHTFTHPDLNTTSVDWYNDDIMKCEEAIGPWVDTAKYFRYPCLHQGSTEVKYSTVSQFLAVHKYVNVPVTIDNDDWRYNKEYAEALNEQDSAAADSIGCAYIAHMQEMTLHYDSVALAKLNRDVKHILLIHMTQLNSVYLGQLLTWHEEQGWRFITPAEALTDSVYQVRDTYIGPNGTSWLLRF